MRLHEPPPALAAYAAIRHGYEGWLGPSDERPVCHRLLVVTVQPLDQRCSKTLAVRGHGPLAGHVVELIGIVDKIEQLQSIADRVVDELVVMVAHHARGAVVLPVLAVEEGAAVVPAQRSPLDAVGYIDAGQLST